jgi:hypothetical protein
MSEKLEMALGASERHVLRPVCGPINKNAQGECAILMESAVYMDTDVVIYIKFKRHECAERFCRMGKFDHEHRGKS